MSEADYDQETTGSARARAKMPGAPKLSVVSVALNGFTRLSVVRLPNGSQMAISASVNCRTGMFMLWLQHRGRKKKK